MTADVVVVTWNSGERVLHCLDRLAEQDASHSVWVVDNASSDGTVAGIRSRFPDVSVVELERNIGFGPAVNRGVARGEGEAIVLVNDDVELEPGALTALLAPLTDAEVGMVAGLTMIPGSRLVDGFGIELDATLAAYNRLRREQETATPGLLLGPSGGLAAYRRQAFEEAGGFDERLFAYGEDVDLALRLRGRGWRAAASVGARGVHIGGASIGADSPRQRWLAGFARGFLLRRYGVLGTRHAARALVIEAIVVGAGLVRGRTLAHMRGRVAGWRAAGRERLPLPPGSVDTRINAREALLRLRHAR
jgi:N-acetylglucosaminyl-diphospho-decaprenol L-rhamnosyltransferase